MDFQNDFEQENEQQNYNKMFRTAVMGFKKEDVISYLTRIARERRKESERYASAMRSLDPNHSAADSVEAANVRDSENIALKSENEMLKLRIQELEAEAVQNSEEQSAANEGNVNIASTDEIIALQKKLEESEFERLVLEEKLRTIDLDKNKAASMLQDARGEAMRLKTEAFVHANQIVQDAQSRVSNLSAVLDNIDEAIDSASSDYLTRLNKCSAQFDEIKSSTAELRNLLNEIQL